MAQVSVRRCAAMMMIVRVLVRSGKLFMVVTRGSCWPWMSVSVGAMMLWW